MDDRLLRQRPLGRTGLSVSEIGFGAAPLGDLYSKLDDVTAIATVEHAHRGGVTLFDTSPHYGRGLAEHRCGTALRRVPRDSFVISTKVGRRMDPFGRPEPRAGAGPSPGYIGGFPHEAVIDYSFDGTLRSAEQSLLRLGLDRIDILLIHDVDVWTHGTDGAERRFREAMEGAYPALDRLRREGLVTAIGLGLNEAEMCVRFAAAGEFDVMLLAGRYSLLEQPALDVFLPLAQRRGIGVMLGGVFNSGILATGAVPGAKYNYGDAPAEVMTRVAAIERVCRAHDVPLPAVAINFALAHPAVSSVVLGAVTPGEVQANLSTYRTAVPNALWRELRAEGLLGPGVPVPSQP